MSSPQLENGYTRIANEILDHLVCYPFSGRELQIILFVIRKTYGYNKKTDWISLTQFENATGTERSFLCRLLKKLVARKTLVKEKNCYGLNKNWQEWVVVRMTPVAWKTLGSGVEATTGSGVDDTHKRHKDKYTKERKKLIKKLSTGEKEEIKMDGYYTCPQGEFHLEGKKCTCQFE